MGEGAPALPRTADFVIVTNARCRSGISPREYRAMAMRSRYAGLRRAGSN